MEGATRRAHLVGTTSGSDSTSLAIFSSWLIVVGFSIQSFYVRLGMVCFTYLGKHLGTIPPSILLTAIAAAAWDRPRIGHLRQMTICHLKRSSQAVPATTFGDRRHPLLPSTAKNNWRYRPAPWSTPLCRSEESSKSEDAMRERYCKIQGVGEREAGNEPAKPPILTTINIEKKGTMSSGKTRRSLISSRDKIPNETCPNLHAKRTRII